MANISYLSLSGETQGLISAGCSTLDSVGNKAQPEHKDQIMVYALMHSISRSQNVNHHELIITKPVDKSSPLLAKALSDNEKMAICEFILYRTSKALMNPLMILVKIIKLRWIHILSYDQMV
ncbi:type VI secretion system tube protein TssD, partial [Escherichia coli]|uniref:type VI secretion system tube protein TssD n=1 Tax=Escherichia coli TaxID=562 RepID=UPI001FCEE924